MLRAVVLEISLWIMSKTSIVAPSDQGTKLDTSPAANAPLKRTGHTTPEIALEPGAPSQQNVQRNRPQCHTPPECALAATASSMYVFITNGCASASFAWIGTFSSVSVPIWPLIWLEVIMEDIKVRNGEGKKPQKNRVKRHPSGGQFWASC